MASPDGAFAIISIDQGEWLPLLDDDGTPLPGIRGRAGANGSTGDGLTIGVDAIEMAPGSAFPIHVHPGHHVLYVVTGEGFVHVDGVDHPVRAGDTMFLPADSAHGVHTSPSATTTLLFIAVGHPHRPIDARDRMRRVDPR